MHLTAVTFGRSSYSGAPTAARFWAALCSLVLLVGGAAALVPVSPAGANPAGTSLVISEVYGAGGNPGATFNADFVELYNPTSQTLPLNGLSIQFRSASGSFTVAPFALAGSVPGKRHYLIRMSGIRSHGVALPAPNAVANPKISMSALGGQVLLLTGTAPLTASGDLAGHSRVVDMVGLGGSRSFEADAGPGTSVRESANRNLDSQDTDDNAADFALAAPSPTKTEPPGPLVVAAVATPGAVAVRSGTTTVSVRVTGTGPQPSGPVEIRIAGVLTATVIPDENGNASATIGPFLQAGTLPIVARFTGDDAYLPADSSPVVVAVTKATPSLTVTARPLRAKVRDTRVLVTAALTAPGLAVKGKVRIFAAGSSRTLILRAGKASLRLPRFTSVGKKKIVVTFLGSGLVTKVAKSVTIRVIR